MRQSEVKRVKPDATEPTPLNKEVPIIQRYSE